MKKISFVLAVVLLLSCLAGCESEKTVNPAEQGTLTISGEGVNVRQVAVDYMKAMANIKWTAGIELDYSTKGAASLIYKPGETYLGMVYNNNATGLEKFQSVLDADGKNTETVANWNYAPGNSCATSVEHAWQQVCPGVEYQYSVDMMPYYEDTGVLAIGDIDWSVYNGSNTNTIVSKHDRQVIFEAYAKTLPGDAFVRYLDNGGHALMVTKEPVVSRNGDGSINMTNSYVYLTDQNNRLHTRREYPSSWEVDREVSFADALADGYLPVTCAELVSGVAPDATFEVANYPKAEDLAKGNVPGNFKCNYCVNVVTMEVFSGDELVASAVDYPYTRTFGYKELGKELGLKDLASGKYTLKITAEVGLGSITLVNMDFSK